MTGSLLRPDGQPFVGQITFDPLDAPLVVAPGQVVVQTKVISSTNPSGQFSATLEAGRYRLTAATISGIRFTVPDTDGSYDILSLVTGGLNQAPDFVPVTGAGDMLQSVYDPNGDGKVTSAVTADSVPWSGITSAPSLQPLDPDLTELAANQGIIRTNGAWEGTLSGEDITAQAITAGLFVTTTEFTGDEQPGVLVPWQAAQQLVPAIAETLEDLQAASVLKVSRWAYVQTGDPLGHWVYCPESTTASNGTNVVRPTSIASDSSPGRWEKIPAASGGGGSEETAASILTKLLTVDGAGSGLDADTLDGQSSAAFQPVDSDLTSIAALTTTSFGRGLLDDADAAALRASAGLGTLATQNGTFSGTSSGTNTGDETASGILTKLLTVDGSGSGLDADTLDGQSSAAFQPADSDLTSIAALTTTSFGRGLLDDADAAALRASAGLGTLATQDGTFSGTSSGTNTGDETASGILTKLLTVDGSGSGLDADTLDGQSSAAFQPVDSDLTSIAALTTTSFGRGLLDDADAAAGRTTLGVVIGTDVQAYDADLADLADGSLSGGKVGSGIDAGNITAGTLPDARLSDAGTSIGSFGNGSYIPTITVDAKGRVTAVTTNAVSGGGGTSQLIVLVVPALGYNNLPSTLQFFGGSTGYQYSCKADLAGYSQVRLVGVKSATTGAAGTKLILRYIDTFSTTASSWLDIGTSEVSVAGDVSAGTVLDSGWINLATGAKADVFFSVLASGGDGVTDPFFGNLYAEFK